MKKQGIPFGIPCFLIRVKECSETIMLRLRQRASRRVPNTKQAALQKSTLFPAGSLETNQWPAFPVPGRPQELQASNTASICLRAGLRFRA